MNKIRSSKLAIRTCDEISLVKCKNILFCEANGRYTYIHFVDRKSLLVAKSLRTIEEKLPTELFFRVHKSVILNIEFINSISSRRNSIILQGMSREFTVSRRRKKELIKILSGLASVI